MCFIDESDAYRLFTETKRTLAQARFALIRHFIEECVPLADLANQHQVSVRTLRRWVRTYEQQGLRGLIRKSRFQPELHQVIEGLALQNPPPSAAAIHR